MSACRLLEREQALRQMARDLRLVAAASLDRAARRELGLAAWSLEMTATTLQRLASRLEAPPGARPHS